jgi:predicted nucleic acid-binding Zn ribbon protein
VLRPGEKACAVCFHPFKAYGKGKYCGDECRRKAIAKQRRARRRREGIGIY